MKAVRGYIAVMFMAVLVMPVRGQYDQQQQFTGQDTAKKKASANVHLLPDTVKRHGCSFPIEEIDYTKIPEN